MSVYSPGYQQQVLYKADPTMTQSMKSIRNQLSHICRNYVNQYVRIETIDGHVYTGRIVGCDRGLLHIAVPKHGGTRGIFGNPFYGSDEMILTLVLYELLVILLYA